MTEDILLGFPSGSETRVDAPGEGEAFLFRLYVAGDAPNSAAARSNLRSLCENHLSGPVRIEIVDLLEDPQRAFSDGVFVTPLLVKIAPGPVCRVVGSLHEKPKVLAALGVGELR